MDPFRNELGAAHAKIAKLEADVAALQDQRSSSEKKIPPPTSMLDSKAIPFIAGIVFCVVVAAGFLLGRGEEKAAGQTRDENLRELAAHPPPAPDLFPPSPANSAGTSP